MHESYHKALNVMFTQISAHKGIKLFGGKGGGSYDGVIPGNPVIQLIPFDQLSQKDKEEALEAVNIITEKR